LFPFQTNINALIPTIELSNFAISIPASGESSNFSHPKFYTVIAGDGSKKTYSIILKLNQTPRLLK